MKNNFKKLFLVSLFVFLSSCGYTMRGTLDVPPSIKSVSLVSENYSDLINSISMSLVAGGIEVQSLQDKSLFGINVQSETFDRRQLTISTSGRVNEYELIYRISYQISAPKEDAKTQTITLYRDYAYDENNVMGNTDREDSIKKEMISTATTLIFNKLKASAKKYTN